MIAGVRPLGLVLCLVFAPAWGAETDARARDAYNRLREGADAKKAAVQRLDAWEQARQVPLWRDSRGESGAWEEVGPRVLLGGWGGMENTGRMCALAVDPRDRNRLYAAAASGGLWKSEDRGASWRPIADFESSLNFGALAIDPIDPDTVYAGTGEPHYSIDSFHGAGMLRSRDRGKSWDLLGSEPFIGHRFTRIVPHPRRTGFLFAATTRGVYRTVDGGGTWVRVLDGVASDLTMDPLNPNRMLAALGLPWGDARNGIYASGDGGETWKRVEGGWPRSGGALGRLQMDICRDFPQVVYAAIFRNAGGLEGIYKSTDFGSTWARLPSAIDFAGDGQWYNNCLAVCPTNPNVVFVGGYSSFRTIDGGQTWEDNTRSYAGGIVHPDHHGYAFDPHDPNTLYMCGDGGLFRTNDLGGTWESVSRGIGTVQFQYVDVHPWDPKIAYGGTQDNGTNKYQGDPAWLHVFTGDGGTTRVNWNNPDIVYTEYINLAICKSVDAGRSWQWGKTAGINLNEGALFYAPFNLDPSNPDVLVAGTQRVYRSEDAAESWRAISPPLGGFVSAVTVAPTNPRAIYAGTHSGRVWVTPDQGATWKEITAGVRGPAYVSDICVDPRNARTAYLSLASWGPDRFWRTEDAGDTWTDVMGDLPDMPVRMAVCHPQRPDTVFIATEIGVFVSENRGKMWRRFGRGLPNVPVFTIVANPRTGYLTAGTHGRGAWRIPLPD